MHIKFVEIQNFRKLKSCRVEFTNETTLFVGANNSGKTTAMDALIKFLDVKDFTINDVTLSNWLGINKIGERWLKCNGENLELDKDEIGNFLPTMDIWLHVQDDQIHYVTHLIPSLDWSGGLLGVRLTLEPKDIESLYKDFLNSVKSTQGILLAVNPNNKENDISLWPKDLRDYLSRKFQNHLAIKSYLLDPTKCLPINKGQAQPQILPIGNEPIDGDPFKSLFLVHHINAQRGFSDPANKKTDDDESAKRIVGNLSTQLRKYYNTHLNPTKSPDPTDIDALQAIEKAQSTFDIKLREGFKNALDELENLGYPGFSNPKISISTRLEPMDGLNHESAVQFDLIDGYNGNELRLPEQYNGLGYQNLISIIFKLMRFRDEWMKVGKVAKNAPKNQEDFIIPPLHIVLVEEPEAHLHIQVQQVFIRKAYEVLCNHPNLKKQTNFTTQLIVSTHSGHIAHEMPFSSLRYFRRIPPKNKGEVPTSIVVNLSDVFGQGDETERFVTRYLQSTHCDLFFADAAILVEGPAERMLVPHFIRHKFSDLNNKYISLLEIGGSHAHTLKPLIDYLGLTSLIITDLDSVDPNNNNTAIPPARNQSYVTGNYTLKTWLPNKKNIDDLLNLQEEDKVKTSEEHFYSVRVAYQSPIKVKIVNDGLEEEALPYTFEDALVFQNLNLFKNIEGNGLVKKFRNAINEKGTMTELGKQFFEALRNGKKAEFALELIFKIDPNELEVPKYIYEGLHWLEEQLQVKPSFNVDAGETIGETVDETAGVL
ncbi:AAA family ATPase [Schinkia azotoformans]|uniref:AAA+ ATPase domain-containing protein n=1 Tax=Schinkia azotoformans LMG 9581 TaxID=1131731 RepID=K6DQJ8_SCHAZ|nr:AAA family ATPase [Schinkia azotoformans]EKN63041.1 hypothetical protein BAZO_18733 [Schinkia azotoformans LMG 9581]MEC1639105.1 AAA family ATPase [Schinkia azotoformans]MEC1945134.1 AAA family ATPase [Schinkia azotoformans]